MSEQPSAYIIGHITVKSPQKWADYRRRVPATLAPWGADVVFRGRLASVLAGEHAHTDTVVIRFPNLQAVNDWHSSPSYQALIPLRNEATAVALLSYEA
ncbi:MAG: hypothetical protein A3K19_04510 [Lentisphaerae bacterium RIFOXYB12_FULL_65_16]|nr:MAG: hypothetical protein A3K18_34980 [Lentisphaerae bacterium RIFOXYA12_64_32]OGV84582.1 MAG: hypothetical protein A3K19_04510 [Lentisphaerae bacterium RIFOXYB12_FULL_65_16]